MPPKKPLIVIDPGHGGQDPGAVSPSTGRRESDINLSLARAFEEAAQGAPFDTLVLRHEDVLLSLEDRARRANEAGASALLSFHCNASQDPGAKGFEIWTSPGKTEADRLATFIFLALEDLMPTIGRTDYDDGDPDKEARFYVLRKTGAPAVLIEFGFISNPADEGILAKPEMQIAMAAAVHKGLETWLGWI